MFAIAPEAMLMVISALSLHGYPGASAKVSVRSSILLPSSAWITSTIWQASPMILPPPTDSSWVQWSGGIWPALTM